MYYIYSKPKTGVFLSAKKSKDLILLKSVPTLDDALEYIHKNVGWRGEKLEKKETL